MSNPTITRLGVNQFWYNHWLTNKKYSEYTNQDTINSEFVQSYIDHGANFTCNIFLHEHWYSKKFKQIRTLPSRSYMQFYRRHYYSNDIVGIEHSYLIRYTTGEYFPLRTWYLRYNNWVIISIQWFKPDKSKAKKGRARFTNDDVSFAHAQANPIKSKSLRNNLYYTRLLRMQNSIPLSYSF